jgi:acyl-CoA dehydrogenase family protein 9
MSNGPKSFVRGLFAGEVQRDRILPYPLPEEEERETTGMILESWERFAADNVDPERIEAEEEIPEEVRQGLADLGFLGLTIPEEYGGFGADIRTFASVMEAICAVDASVSTILGGHLSLCAKGIMLGGSPEQKKRWLPRMAAGELIGAMALTETEAGSDARALSSRADLDPSGAEWLLNGSKIWITNGGYANLYLVYAKTEEEGKRKVSAFIVPRESPGLAIGAEERKMGLHGSSTISFSMDDARIPRDYLLGEAGKGFALAGGILETGRLMIAAMSLGGSKRMLREAAGHAVERRQFGRPIAEFEMIRAKTASSAANIYAMESIVRLTAALADRRQGDVHLESSCCKGFCTERGWWNVNEALQTAGGIGFSREYPYERFVRDARINMIFEGTNEILRSFLAMQGCRGAATLGEKGYEASNRTLGPLPEPLGEAGEAFDRDVAAFAEAAVRALSTHGDDLVEREYVQARLANAVISLYVRAAVLSRSATLMEKKGCDAAEGEIELCLHVCWEQEGTFSATLGALERNQDERTTRISDLVYRAGRYSWDLL